MPKEHPWSLLELQSSTDPAASRGEAGSSTTKGVRAVAMETAEMSQGKGSNRVGKMAWRLGDTYGKQRGSKGRILQATNSHSDTAQPQHSPISWQWPPGAAAPPRSSKLDCGNTGNEHGGLTL